MPKLVADPATDPVAGTARAHRDDATLVLQGRLDRAAIAGLWKQLPGLLPGVERIDLAGVSGVDSAGTALLAELADRLGASAMILGEPAGLAELRAAYRMTPQLRFVGQALD